ncbi:MULTISPECIES: ATP-grasp domain-containing protein [Chryseobacterium]|uniref:Biotin carboxylase n=1 Tax=Chryseobacterium camelliae TaxID=1265445 RepID=A0ABU0TH66_9FLAO|nr:MULTISPECIES: ATP-grasp domain-containing protein [Chryseobacterium]MDT3405802.1 biotin carboxylase [Pseudacidovorax intermedius]MDQ1096392.1 biotin carboxylase [Chryseobacterium camelliae]MDQ1100332.1 biotin carboxylase [Chryseobacterium sp. SORGH_AS_1048]MDR6087674.1 biotin carboxylase [Chryseobacterium sp. SORGH_AS_0909]MDR6132049.1 biotin carboxylase [Chryseobacterium sp. SORGH_AS_1175]
MKEKIIVCISCYYKGYDFMDEMQKLGNRVILITSENLKDKNWPWHAIEETFYMPETKPSVWNLDHLVQGFSYLMQTRKADAVVALDDYDVEKAALVRETFRIPGMGQTTHRYFRDKLAMRQKAEQSAIEVPEFTAVFNNDEIHDFTQRVPAPWVLKPRSEASASGIRKIRSENELWEALNALGDERHLFLLESFKPGDVYHVDSLTYNNSTVFTSASQYLAPPMQVSHEGGVFMTKTLGKDSVDFKDLNHLNSLLLKTFGLKNGATHTEFIKGKEDGKWYFLETSSRVGGAHIPDLVEAATHINIWREWARIEDALLKNKEYKIADPAGHYAGLIIALIKDQNPDYRDFESEEAVKFLPIDHHIGIVYRSDDPDIIQEKLNNAAVRIQAEMLSILPPKTKPTS